MAVQDLLIGGVVALKMVLNALLELAGAVEKWLWVSRAVVSGKQQDGYEASLQPPPYTVSCYLPALLTISLLIALHIIRSNHY